MTNGDNPHSPEPLQDQRATYPVTQSATVLSGQIWDVVREEVDLGHSSVVRDFVAHPGAVAVLALNDRDECAMIRQYRHPVRSFLWEIPAGLLDVPGEPLVVGAQRELAEEADLKANQWHTLVDYYTSPGGSDEPIRIFLARELTEIPQNERFERFDEELDMELAWVGIDEAVSLVLSGQIHNPNSVIGVLAAAQSRAHGWNTLRAPDAPWLRTTAL